MSQIAYIQIEDDHPFKCIVPEGLAVHVGDLCVVKIGNINDVGRVVDLSDDGQGESCKNAEVPGVVRCATLQDQAKADETALRSKMALSTCTECAAKHKLNIRLIKVRYSYDRKMLMVVFSSEERVDYRELIKDLSAELHTRIEMKQIGVRDEAGMVGGMGSCGRALCCCTWLKSFESINVKMAKAQRLSLNPVAISGMCGRLKCCLRYEYDQYKDADRDMPRDGERVKCAEGEGCVCGKNILAGKVKLRLEDNKIIEYDVEELRKFR